VEPGEELYSNTANAKQMGYGSFYVEFQRHYNTSSTLAQEIGSDSHLEVGFATLHHHTLSAFVEHIRVC
jgi:hypothetical protein